MSIKGEIQGRGLILLTGLLWSLAGLFIKSLDVLALTISFYRSFFAALFFLCFMRKARFSSGIPLLISAASYTAAISSFVWANKLTTAANAIVLQYTAPIFVFLFIRFLFDEAITRSNLMTLVGGMIGVSVIFAGSAGEPDLRGVIVAIISGFLLSIYMTNLRFVGRMNPITLTFVNNVVCAAVLFPLLLPHSAPNLKQLLALAAMGVFQLGIPYFLFSKGLEKISLQEASLIVLIEPVLNPIWVAWMVGEIPSVSTLLGGGIILLSLAARYVRLMSR